MSKSLIGPLNLIAGQSTTIQLQQSSGIWASEVVINNQSPFTCTLQMSSDQDFVPPYYSSAFRIPRNGSYPVLTPITSFPVGTYLGTVTGVIYFPEDGSPGNLPGALSAFPGGSALLLNSANSLGLVNSTQSYHIAIPPGAGQITIHSDPSGFATGPQPSYTVTGDQSGTVYGTGNLPIGATVVSLAPSLDTSVTLAVTQGLSPPQSVPDQVYASPGIAVPTYATNAASFTGTGHINKPATGAIFLFDADNDPANAAGFSAIWVLQDHSTGFDIATNGAGFRQVDSVPDFAAIDNQIHFGPLRIAQQVDVILAVGAGRLTVRYALGP